VDEEEIRIVAQRECSVVVCTESNMKLASGAPPIVSYLREGVPLGLGTDGPASNNDLDLFGEMDQTAKLQKLREGDPTVVGAAQVLHMASVGGARVLGFHDMGLLEPGYHADLILVRTDRPHMRPLYNPVSQLVYSARGSDVEHVWIGGRHVLQQGRITTLDPEAIQKKTALLQVQVKSHIPER
jgi:5-methylthioadenosine/S-adenosylhomocysteine deaminase